MIHPSRRAFLKTLLSLPIAVQMDVEALLWTPSPIVVVPAMPQKFVVGSGMKALIEASMRQRAFFEQYLPSMEFPDGHVLMLEES